MKSEPFVFKDFGGVDIYTYKWAPENITTARAVVQIAHGLSETAERYEEFSKYLTDNGYIVYANDHRGHGKTAGSVENLGYAGENGFNSMVDDMKELNDIIRENHPGLPVYLFGHSMGSHLSQTYIIRYGNTLDGVILSGTSGKQGLMLNFGIYLAKREVKKKGRKSPCHTINSITFGGYNKQFMPTRTEFDWLSRDEKQVDKYVRDEFCGAVPTAGFFHDYFLGFKYMHQKENMEKVPKNLPIYIFSGDKDPVGGNTKSVLNLVGLYRNVGIKDLSYKFYKDGRHEMLNELNKDEVMKDVLNWLNAHLKK